MSARIRRRPKVVEDVEGIADFIARDSLEFALRFVESVEATLSWLADFPGAGAPFHSDAPELQNIRTFRVKDFPNHIIFYRRHADAIEVIRIIHGARDLDAELQGN